METTFGAVRSRVCAGAMLPIGLWLSARAASQLAESASGAPRLRERLAGNGLAVVTLNAFPYGHFHDEVVKHRVYEPSWCDARRALYTTGLADLLPDLLAPGVGTASISTLPLGWRGHFGAQGCGAGVGVASALLEQVVRHLAAVEDRTGVRVTVDLEPEPGCMLDRAEDVIGFFAHALAPRRGGPDPRRYLGICHDVCHAAVMFEEQSSVLRSYRDAGIRVNKVQVSSAPVADGNADTLAVLAGFAEPRWLHQTCVRGADGRVRFFEDLPAALERAPAGEWRTHFHVPVFAPRIGALGTTQGAIADCIREIASWPADERPAFEVETYAWDAIPGTTDGAGAVADGIAREIEWCRDLLRDAGLPPGQGAS